MSGTDPTGKKGINTDRLKLEIRRSSVPFLMLIVLIVVGFLNGSNIIRNLSGAKFWKDYTEYRVAFDNPEGVIPSRHELRIAGVKSGYIKDAKLEGGRGVLTLAVDKKDAPLYKDAHVQIRPVTPLEDMYVDITSRGHESAGKLRSGEHGDILPIINATTGVRQTESMVEIGRVLNILDDDVRPRFASLLTQLGGGLSGTGGANLREAFAQLAPFLVNAQRFSQVLKERQTTVKRLVHNIGITTKVLGDRDKELTSFIRSGRDTVTELADNDAPFAATLRQLPPTVNSLQSAFAALQNTEPRLDAALRSVRPVAAAMPDGLKALQEFSTDADPAVTALRPALRAVRPLARELRPTAKTLATTFPLLAKNGPIIDRATDKLAQPRCRQVVSDLINHLSSMAKFNQTPGLVSPAGARADVSLNFTNFGEFVKPSAWYIENPCWTGELRKNFGGAPAPAGGGGGSR